MSLVLPEAVEFRLHELQRAVGSGAQVLLVGGAVRELLLGRLPGDLDVEVIGLDQDELRELLKQLWPGKTHCVGKIFSVFKATFADAGSFDISGAVGPSFDVTARRRDFTINAMAWDLSNSRLLDPHGGEADLRAEVLRCVDPATFVEDPLRVYRAAQFVARLGFAVEPQTRSVCLDLIERGGLDELPPERISEEWKKLLLASRPSRGLELLDQWGLIERCYPELQAIHDVPQDVRWHPEGDVWVHTLLVVDCAAHLCRETERGLSEAEKLVAMFGALVHDLGKPATTRVEPERITAHGHEAAGRGPALQFLQRLRLGEEIEMGVLECVTEHMRPSALARAIEAGSLSQRQATNALRRIVRDVQSAGWKAFMTLCEADKRGRGDPAARHLPYHSGLILNPLLEATDALVLAPQSLLQGRDLLELGISPGPRMGQLIAEVERQRDEGVVATHQEALEWLRAHLQFAH